MARPPEILRADAFFPAFIAGLETVLSARGHALLLQVAERDDLAAYRRLVQEGRVDGVFVTDLHVDDERPALLEELACRPCSSARTSAALRRGSPRSASTTPPGSRGRVRHLRRPRAHPDRARRRTARRGARPLAPRGVEQALAEAGLPEGPCVEADFSAEAGARATAELLDLAERPTAIVYANDLMAMAGLSLAVSQGSACPTTCRSPASTTSRSPPTSSPRSRPCTPTSWRGAAPQPPGCWS